MRTCYDSVNVASLPTNGDLYLGYTDGHWPNYSQIVAKFPGKTVVGVTVFATDNQGDMLDVENGDATPAQAPGWIAKRRAAGHQGPLVYCSEAARSAVVSAFALAKVALPGLFIAAYPGKGAVLQDPFDVGHQYSDMGGGGAYDISVVIDYLPGIDPAPLPPPPISKEEILYAFENSKGQTVIVGNQQSTGHTVVVTSGADAKVDGGWSLADVTGNIEKAYPGTVVVVE